MLVLEDSIEDWRDAWQLLDASLEVSGGVQVWPRFMWLEMCPWDLLEASRDLRPPVAVIEVATDATVDVIVRCIVDAVL